MWCTYVCRGIGFRSLFKTIQNSYRFWCWHNTTNALVYTAVSRLVSCYVQRLILMFLAKFVLVNFLFYAKYFVEYWLPVCAFSFWRLHCLFFFFSFFLIMTSDYPFGNVRLFLLTGRISYFSMYLLFKVFIIEKNMRPCAKSAMGTIITRTLKQ